MDCPHCGKLAKPVQLITLLHHVVAPLNQQLPCDEYFFCANISCGIVYFSKTGTVFDHTKVRKNTNKGLSDTSITLCYCFDVTQARVLEEIGQTGESASKAFVVEQTKLKNCACDVRNPSGRCCLKDFPK
ncbi:hypothetical protein BGP75_16825 [Motiliproteus sp. MSK22-1]|nr:hypothetical protein BGP75_16825 [Motiliproteus sp. MSK22-1]